MTNKEAIDILINYFTPPIIRSDGKSVAHFLALEAIQKAIDALKAEPKHGRWVHKYGDGHEEPAITGGECSICGYVHMATNYCPNCGAKMDAQIGEDKSHPFAESVMMGMDEVEE